MQAYIKKLKEFLAGKTRAELLKDDHVVKTTALKCVTNIQTLIRDLFHTPPIFKAKVTLSWKEDQQKKVRLHL